MSLSITATTIPGLLRVTLPVHGDERGWFKENWQREKKVALGLPDFRPVQNNISFNEEIGTTRGIHAEPWEKFISVATGRIFGAWVDLRAGSTFGAVYTTELGPHDAIYVPRGVGNSFQTIEPRTAYTYLVNDHWRPDAEYVNLNLADETINVNWPIPLAEAIISDKDLTSPALTELSPIQPRKTMILGANGQLGRALRKAFPGADAVSRQDFDIADSAAWKSRKWREYDTIINAAAYTRVDEAETSVGRRDAWRSNVHGVVELARTAIDYGLTVVHVSSDYVFDGENEVHTADELFSPLGVYGQTKAAGDAIIQIVPKHFIIRTSWVIGDGNNFIATMERLAREGVNPRVVDDQIGLLSYTDDIAAEIARLLKTDDYGTHNVTSGGEPKSWYQIARETFAGVGADPDRISAITTAKYSEGKNLSPRPRFSTLD